MKKNIIFAILGFIGGAAAGITGTIIFVKHKDKKDVSEVKTTLTKDLPKSEAETEDAEEIETISVTPEQLSMFKEIISKEGYAMEEESEDEEADPAEYEYPMEDDDEAFEEAALKASKKMRDQIAEWMEKNKGKIEMITEDVWDYDNDFPEDDFEREELFYFKDEDILTDEDGNILYNPEKYVGNLFEKTRFSTNNWKVLYVRNFPMEMKYKVNKPFREYHDTETGKDVIEFVTKDEFFF